jgi:FkbM family methyltransferase
MQLWRDMIATLRRIGQHVRIRSAVLSDYWFFERLGIPKVRREKISKSVIRDFIKSNPIIIDCGAHDGADSVQLARVLDGTVYAFEPVPELFKRLVHRARNDPRIKCVPVALSDRDGTAAFNASSGGSDASGSLLAPTGHLDQHPDVHFDHPIEVQTRTLETWARESSVTAIDVMWLDMQGAELMMLQAGQGMLASVRAIHTEVSLTEIYAGGVLYPELRTFLEQRGFRVHTEAIPAGWDAGNVLFVRD